MKVRDQFFFIFGVFFRQLRVCYFVAPSLTRGRVCNLLLLQGLASAVLLESESRGAQYLVLLSQFVRLLQLGRPRPRIYISQKQAGVSWTTSSRCTSPAWTASSIIACSVVAEEACPLSCSLASAVVLSPVYTSVLHSTHIICLCLQYTPTVSPNGDYSMFPVRYELILYIALKEFSP
jgi:hypothetical protein